jgi:outer membrane protein OmpA-like peptidoglycan-associated protein
MNSMRTVAGSMAIVAAGFGWSCAPRQVKPSEPARPGQSLIVLLPDDNSGMVGKAIVSNPAGTTELVSAWASTTVAAKQPPAAATTMSEAEVKRLFGDALSALPLPPRRFMLNFRFDSDQLTAESGALIPAILQSVKDYPAPELVVVGHTDTTGSRDSNFALGLKRASMVRSLLVAAGLDAASIEVTTLGETDLLVPTADNAAEPRNRRVEIAVK